MATRKRAQATAADADADPGTDRSVKAIRHPSKRKNIPPAGLEAQGRVEETPKVRHEYNPHLPTRLRFADDPAAADRLPQLLATARERALSADEAALLADALRRHEPWLEWSGKRERPWFEVEPPTLRIHERVIAQAMLRVLALEDVNRDLFADPQQSHAEAVHLQRIEVWRQRGYHVSLFFLSLPIAEMAVARVAERVRQGGHDIPEAVIRRRFVAGRANFERHYRAAVDAWAIYDNAGDEPVLIEWGERS